MEGKIVKNISNDYFVKTDKGVFICKPRGLFRLKNLTLSVGDNVIIDEVNNYILDVLPRKNNLVRPNVSNVDKAIIVTSVKPKLDTNLLDKLLMITSYNGIVGVICFTKLDLLNDNELSVIEYIMDYYRSVGYVVTDNSSVSCIKDIIKGNICVFVGQSGSGKSTLLNRLDSSLELKTDEISVSLGRGKHTTRDVSLYSVCDGFVMDTPGFSSLDLKSLSNYDIRDNMYEFFDNLDKCKYRDCLHVKENDCYVKSLVDNGRILKSRYDNYLSFLKK